MSKSTKFIRFKQYFINRWCSSDLPKCEPRFQVKLFMQDVLAFVLIPVSAIIIYKICENGFTKPRQSKAQSGREQRSMNVDSAKSQIIDFRVHNTTGNKLGLAKRAPGTLVKLKLLNVVETYSNTPVHAQIIDSGIGGSLRGGTVIGDASSDNHFQRININFRFVRIPNNQSQAAVISARALSLDGTLGLEANKKEGFFARSALGSATNVGKKDSSSEQSTDFKQIIIQALTSGLMQEFNNDSQVEKNRSQVLTLRPGMEFFAELTDFFPGGN